MDPETPPRLAPPRASTFHPGDWAILSRCWFPVARAEAVTDRPLAARLLDVELVLYRAAGTAVVARDLCPHRGTQLSLGWVEDGAITCPYHGFRYAADGRCIAVPAHPEAAIPPRLRVTVFPAIERFGLIWASLNGTTPALPRFDAWEDPEFQPILAPTIDIASSAGRQMEGFLDVAHFAWAHTGTFGDRTNPIVPSYRVERTAGGIRASYRSSVSNYPKGMQHLAPEGFEWVRHFEVFPPFAASLEVVFPGPDRLWILNAPAPVSARQTRLFCPLARNFGKDGPVEEVHEFNLRIFNEDKVMVESQKPEDLPLDLGEEAHILADRSSLAYRRLLQGMGLGEGFTR